METELRVEGVYQLEFREFYHALRWYTWRKFWWVYCILIVAVTVGLMTGVFHSDDDPISSRLVAILPPLIIPVLLVVFFLWGIYRNARRQFKTNNSLREARHVIFSEQGIESSASDSSGKVAWTALHQIIETPESFLLFYSSAVFAVIPKRSMESEAQIQTLRDLIRQKLGTKAQLKK